MATLKVEVKGQEGAVSGALLSLTSSDGYINNNVTNAEGEKDFTSLFPGEYYLKPVLKEYIFEPSALTVTLNEGEAKTISFQATRVAFSVFGHVKTLNGNPAKSVSVEAIGPDGSYDETKTDQDGNYRLRGLKPDHVYTISTKLGKDKEGETTTGVERAEPERVEFVMKKEDVEHVDFVIFLKDSRFDIMGEVFALPSHLPTLTVRLSSSGKEGSANAPLDEKYELGPSNFFVFPGLDADAIYTLSLTTSLSSKEYNYTLPTVTVNPKEQKTLGKVLLNVTFDAALHRMEDRMDNGPFFTLLFVCVVAAAIYNRKVIVEFVDKFKNKQNKKKPEYNNSWEFDFRGHHGFKNRR